MIGLYPPESCDLELNDWQQLNVHPPLFYNFTEEELKGLGKYALKGGFTPFDIFH